MMENRSAEQIAENLKIIRDNVGNACVKYGRSPEEVKIMAVTKTVPPEFVNVAVEHGITLLGENRAQELESKYQAYQLKKENIHFIGHLQTNKVKQVFDKVDVIESVDSFRLAEVIDRFAEKGNIRKKIMLEVNIAKEESKNGISPEQLSGLLEQLSCLRHIEVEGIMVIPPVGKSEEYFAAAQNFFIDMQGKKMDNINMRILSMGMSGDYISAIRYGSNLIRLGTAIFGLRK